MRSLPREFDVDARHSRRPPCDPEGSSIEDKETIIQTKKKAPSVSETLDLVCKTLDDDKASDIVVIDLAGKTSMGDYMVLANGTSQRQVGAMTNHLQENLKAAGHAAITLEGQSQCDWVLLDAGDIIVHLFRPEVREFYNLEKIWDAPVPANALTSSA